LPRFYLPYPGSDSTEGLLVHDDKAWRFPSRKEALAFVMDYCREERAIAGVVEKAVIGIEGQDGQWRMFDTRLEPVGDDE
jgi:hypothetical protein